MYAREVVPDTPTDHASKLAPVVRSSSGPRGCQIDPISDILNEGVSIRKLGTFRVAAANRVEEVKQVLNSVKQVLN